MKPPSWKRAGPDGEVEIKFPTGRRFKIEKQYDSNIRHKGEWKVMEWDPRTKDWEWGDTYSPKAYAKQKAMEVGQYDKRGKKVADYSSTFQYESVNEEIHPEVVKAYKKTLDAEDKAGDYNYRSNKARVTRAANHLSKMINKHHPGLDMKGKIKLRTQLQKEDTTTASVAGAGDDNTVVVVDRRRRKDKPPVVLKRFRGFMKDPSAPKPEESYKKK